MMTLTDNKTKLVKISILLSLFVLIFISCDSNASNGMENEKPPVKDFVLTYSAQWDFTSIPWNTTILNADTLYVINSQEEFAKNFPTATSAPDDLSKYSLLFGYGYTTSNIIKTSYNIINESNGAYRLELDLELGTDLKPDVWYVTVLVPKIPDVTVIPIQKNLSGAVPPDESFVNPYREDIIGKWKLIGDTLTYYQNNQVVDIKVNNYAENGVIFDFQSVNNLIVTGIVSDILTAGIHSYHYTQLNVCPTCLPGPNLTISDDSRIFCLALSNNESMTLQSEKATEQGVVKYTLIFTTGGGE
jgi:hypothetical protein